MSVAPIQSTDRGPSLFVLPAADGGGVGGIKSMPQTEMMPPMMASTPKTHFQLEYWATKPERMLPKTLPRGAPAPFLEERESFSWFVINEMK